MTDRSSSPTQMVTINEQTHTHTHARMSSFFNLVSPSCLQISSRKRRS